MQNKFILTDGQKSINLLASDDPNVWTFFSGAPQSDNDILYARVSAAFRAYNLKANTVGSMPFTLNTLNGDEYDNSATWENKVGFLPNPSELFRLDTLSYMATNTVYNLRTSDILGYKTKNLLHAVAHTFHPFINPATMQLEYIERWIGTERERYLPDDPRLVRMWRLDHTTEVLPSPNTEARAIMNSAGEVYYADAWIKHFYERGGVPPTIIAMKGSVSPTKREDEEKSWTNWLLGLGRWRARNARVINADALDVKQFGSSVTDLKNMDTYKQAIENIAMGTGMPLSLLLANSANYATAKEEKATWLDSDIIPFVKWLGYEYNMQVFHPLKLSLVFHPETLDPQQEDETERASAINTFMDFLAKCPTFEMFIGTCDTFGYELSDSLREAAEQYYAEKKQSAEAIQTQSKPVDITLASNIEAQPTTDIQMQKQQPSAKWIPSLDQMRELQRWQELAFRKLKRAEPLNFEWRNDSLPEDVYAKIMSGLAGAETEDTIKALFDVMQFEGMTVTIPPAYTEEDTTIKTLADSINRLADSISINRLSVST